MPFSPCLRFFFTTSNWNSCTCMNILFARIRTFMICFTVVRADNSNHVYLPAYWCKCAHTHAHKYTPHIRKNEGTKNLIDCIKIYIRMYTIWKWNKYATTATTITKALRAYAFASVGYTARIIYKTWIKWRDRLTLFMSIVSLFLVQVLVWLY